MSSNTNLPGPMDNEYSLTAEGGGGLSATVKLVVPLMVLAGLVFGVTFILMYTPTPEEKETKTNSPSGSTGGPPLYFFTSTRSWDPPQLNGPYRNLWLLAPSANKEPAQDPLKFNFTAQDRIFQGFYEAGDTLRRTQFWFENRNKSPVIMELKDLSCTACTGGRVIAIPPAVTRNLLQYTAVAALPVGPFHAFGVGLTQPATELSQHTLPYAQDRLPPEARDVSFQHYREQPVAFKIPAAPANDDKWAPQWGILELTFKVGGDQTKTISADFAVQVEGSKQFVGNRFLIMFHAGKPCELSRTNIDLGRIPPEASERNYEVIVYSTTRGPGSEFGDLEEPHSIVQFLNGATDPANFVQVTKVERIPEDDLVEVESQVKQRVRSAYRLTITVRPRVGDERPDIGAFDRVVAITAGGVTQQLKLSGIILGPVRLEPPANEIVLASFRGAEVFRYETKLVTERAGIELEVLPGESKPENFVYELERLPDNGNQGQYKLKITIPKGQFGQVRGEIVLQVKGPSPQKMRIPLRGLAISSK